MPCKNRECVFQKEMAAQGTCVFEPTDVAEVELAITLYNDVPCQGVPAQVLSMKEEEVIIPSGTILGRTQPVQEVIS